MANLPSNLIDDSVMAVAEGINTGVLAFKDGFQFTDVFKFIPTFLSIQTIVENRDELLAQIKDYDLNERAITIDKLREKLTLSKERAEELVTIVYDVVFGIVRFAIFLGDKLDQPE